MSDIALYMHAGSGNHGCEAIVDSLIRMMPVDHFRMMTNSAAEDEQYLAPEVRSRVDILEENHIADHLMAHVAYYGWRKITGDRESFLRYRYRALTKDAAPKLAVSIGGDNYCYDIMVDDLMLANAMFNRQGTATVLLGCSIEPELLEEASRRARQTLDADVAKKEEEGLLADLNRYQKIIARESITYEALQKALQSAYGSRGREKVVLCPDPAFTLPVDEDHLPSDFASGNTVGINISPMAQQYAASSAVLLESYAQLIRHILDTTNMNVALIPHVVWARSDDRVPLSALKDRFGEDPRVQLIDDAPAEQLKGIIANCRFFIGARTHATIAAYSTLIPTLVLGYSVKALGIARDIFGTYEHYVLPVQTLSDPGELIDAWNWLFAHEDDIRYTLAGSAAKMRAGALRNAEELHRVMQEL